MESYMDWVNNHFTEANNGKYLEMYKLADGSIKKFLDEGFDTVWYHDEEKDKQMCISFIRDNKRVFVTFDQGKQKWLIDFQKVTKDKRGARAKCGMIDEKGNLIEGGIEKVTKVMGRLQEENKK